MDFLTDPFLIDPANFGGPVLVTGAGGCIGAWVSATLARSDVPVIASDLRKSPGRAALIMGEDAAGALDWAALDVTDGAEVAELVKAREVQAIIHLAGLQVPFCAANPALGARVNVEGTINVLEAARQAGINRTVFASSVAALAFPTGGPFKETPFGAYKVANEQTAFVYWADLQVPSIGLRPNVVYGVARDQGISAKNTLGLQAAVLGVPYEIPFTGPYSWLYAGEAAAAFIASVLRDGEGAHVFDLNSRCATIECSGRAVSLPARHGRGRPARACAALRGDFRGRRNRSDPQRVCETQVGRATAVPACPEGIVQGRNRLRPFLRMPSISGSPTRANGNGKRSSTWMANASGMADFRAWRQECDPRVNGRQVPPLPRTRYSGGDCASDSWLRLSQLPAATARPSGSNLIVRTWAACMIGASTYPIDANFRRPDLGIAI